MAALAAPRPPRGRARSSRPSSGPGCRRCWRAAPRRSGSGASVDGPPHRGRDRDALRRAVPPGPRQPALAGQPVEPPAPAPAGDPTRRGGHRAVVRRALAGAQKGAADEGRTVVWVDESGFYLLPGCVRTYAPRGQTPVLRVRLTRDHLSVIGGVTPDGKLLLQVAAGPRPAQPGRGAVPPAPAGPPARQAAGHLGRRPHPPRPAGQGLPRGRRRRAPPPGAAARLRPRPQPARPGRLAPPQARRAGQRVLRRPAPPAPRAPRGGASACARSPTSSAAASVMPATSFSSLRRD